MSLYQEEEYAEAVARLIETSLREDLGSEGDITSRSIFPAGTKCKAIIRAKQAGVLSGVSLLPLIFTALDPTISLTTLKKDGESLGLLEEIAHIEGEISAVLAGERLALNLLQHLSGVATATAELVALIEGTSARLLDTRKTTPGMRLLEKCAVVHGGGCNHRIGLYDQILIKDTHVKAAGGPAAAVRAARVWLSNEKLSSLVEVEVESEAHFAEAIAEHPDRIMLDNMSCEVMERCVALRNQRAPLVQLEASGNVTTATIRAIATTGVDYISVGAITHSVKALDIHLILV